MLSDIVSAMEEALCAVLVDMSLDTNGVVLEIGLFHSSCEISRLTCFDWETISTNCSRLRIASSEN